MGLCNEINLQTFPGFCACVGVFSNFSSFFPIKIKKYYIDMFQDAFGLLLKTKRPFILKPKQFHNVLCMY